MSIRLLRSAPLVAAALLVGCDAGSEPPVEYQVRATSNATTAEVSTDGRAAQTVELPFRAESSASTFAISASAASGVEVTVSVDGTVRERAVGRVVAVRGDTDGQEVEVEGRIDALGPTSVSVRGIAFEVTADTEIEADDDRSSLDAFAVGDVVEIEGRYEGGALIADELELEDDRGDGYEDDEVEVEGPIESVTDGQIVVAGIAFAIDAGTEVEDTAVADLAVGDLVEVEGFFDQDGLLVATEIELDDESDDDNDNDDSDGQ